MKIKLNEPLFIKPENIPFTQDGNILSVRIFLNTIKFVADAYNDDEREFYKKLMEALVQQGTEEFELTQPKGALLQRWIYKTELNAAAKDALIGLLNSEE